jgi:CDP-diacylglycerol pyrophosphatase
MVETEIVLKEELGANLGPRHKMEELFENIDGNTSQVIMNFEGVEFMGRSIAQEYLNQKHVASFEVIEKNVPNDVQKMLDMILKLNNKE